MTEFVSAVPIIPARDIEAAAAWYRDELGFDVFHTEREYGIVGRGESWIHFWGPSDIAPEDSNTMIRLPAAQRWPALKVLYTSGFSHGMLDGALGGQIAGKYLLGKPFRRADLANKIREILDEPAEQPGDVRTPVQAE